MLQMVPQAEKNTKTHLDDANDDGEFHFDRIGKGDFVLSQLPNLQRRKNRLLALDIERKKVTGSRPNG